MGGSPAPVPDDALGNPVDRSTGAAPRMCAISVDLDDVGEYRRLHGLPAQALGATAVYDVALERMRRFAEHLRAPLTLFAIGRDLERAESAERLAALARHGHPVENHSYDHRYDLTRLPVPVLRAQIAQAQTRITAVTGRTPVGFRAPGYTLDDAVLDALEAEGMAFDASVFPCPPYHLAKLGMVGLLHLRGRTSAAIVGDPRACLAPTRPYRPGAWHSRGGRRLLELPMLVTPSLRLPVIGTSLVLAGPVLARELVRRCLVPAGPHLVSLELHGVDFLDAADGLGDLRSAQPDMRLGAASKQRALLAAMTELGRAGYAFVTLQDAAEVLSHAL